MPDFTAPEVSEDGLLGGRIRLLQPAEGYRVATDPVLLAAAVPEAARGCVLDVGTGTGAALLCVLRQRAEVQGVGLELLSAHGELAARSLVLNDLADRGRVVIADALAPVAGIGGAVAVEGFDQVISNPPYHGPGTRPSHGGRATAHMESVSLADWIAVCLRYVKPRGGLTLIHRADRLADILAALHGRAGAVEVIPLWPKPGQPARRVIVRARKGLRSPAVVHPGLCMHRTDGGYTAAAEAVLREGLSLDRAMLL